MLKGGTGAIAGLVDASGGAGRIGVQQARGERDVPEAGGHEDVGRGAALEQTPADVRAIDQRVLRRRGLVIDAAHVDAGAAVQQEVGNRDGLRLVERLLTVAAARVDERGIGVHERSAARRASRGAPRRSASASRRAPGGIAPCPRRRCRARCRGRSPSRSSGSRRRRRAISVLSSVAFFAAMCAARWPKANIGSLMRFRTCVEREELLRARACRRHAPRRRTP